MEDFTFNNWLVAGLLALASAGSFLISEPWLGVLTGGCGLAVVLAQTVRRRGHNMKYQVTLRQVRVAEVTIDLEDGEALDAEEAKQIAEAPECVQDIAFQDHDVVSVEVTAVAAEDDKGLVTRFVRPIRAHEVREVEPKELGEAWQDVVEGRAVKVAKLCEFGFAEEVVALLGFEDGTYEVGIGESMRPYLEEYAGDDEDEAEETFAKVVRRLI